MTHVSLIVLYRTDKVGFKVGVVALEGRREFSERDVKLT
jgi:hypothetical protein